MSVEMWLTRDEAWTVFDTKPHKELMDCPIFYDKVVHISDEEYAEYEEIREEWYAWQRKLAALLDGE